ncbi:hypothetical protein [Arsenicicoccus dermatophilus]|uniref:hypothetical protein n=1 Tax=Arsenicicoccus dermatophilus TaxID=1076331 RepID=UPI001F4C7919|nr:hypothetical protein [Arsenicicoccus dermatophilus]MCH8613209.1 hypothetical protein [Arsenicicoccus dermatophilus]
MTAPTRWCIPLTLALLLAGCSGGDTSTTTGSAASTSQVAAPSATDAAATGQAAAPTSAAAPEAMNTFVPKATAVDDAVAEVRKGPGGASLKPDVVTKSLKSACAAHLAGLPASDLLSAVRGELEADKTPGAAAVAARIVAASQRHMCP